MFHKTTAAAKAFLNLPVATAVEGIAGLFPSRSNLTTAEKSCLKLVKGFLPEDPERLNQTLEWFRELLLKHRYPDAKVKEAAEYLAGCAVLSPAEALPQLGFLQGDQHRQLLKLLLLIGDFDRSEAENELWDQRLAELADGLQVPPDTLERLREECRELRQSRARMLRSGVGILLALGVIGVVLLTAVWLPSLLFGAILAFAFLPLERFFEKRLLGSKRSAAKAAGKFRRGQWRSEAGTDDPGTQKELERRFRQSCVTRAVTLTVGGVVTGALILLVAAGIGIGCYLEDFALRLQNVKTSRQQQPATVAAAPENAPASVPETSAATPADEPSAPPSMQGLVSQASTALVIHLNELKEQCRNQPVVRRLLDELAVYLQQERSQQQILTFLLRKSGGFLAFLGNLIGGVATLLLNLLLTVFFFSLLLGGLAQFRNNAENAGSGSSGYLVKTIFNGRWLPMVNDAAAHDAERIIREVFRKIRIWFRGYLTMIAIDFCVYTTVFLLLKVPYAPLVGIVAGCAILLPYIGPVSSALLTLAVTLAVNGSATGVYQICGIIGIYLIHNGIVEQFFIYPAIIGESLGLTTLETIIVVLLGGLLAGITGMIFALPTAAVIKYLIPQIYRCTGSRLRHIHNREGTI